MPAGTKTHGDDVELSVVYAPMATGIRNGEPVDQEEYILNPLEIEAGDTLIESPQDGDEDVDRLVGGVPDMWSLNYIGLYAQYAAVGLLYGSSGTVLPFCAYVYKGETNVCANANSLVVFAWNLKIFYAVMTDSIRPFGKRRQSWMLLGWIGVLVILFLLAVYAHGLSTEGWLASLMVLQAFMMLSDVPADGYSVELGQLEPPEQRGQILATGQRLRFIFSAIAGVFQTFLLNGRATNKEGCGISFNECWSWGLNVNSYYGLLFVITLILFIPVCFLKEPDASHFPKHTPKEFMSKIWSLMQNLTTLYLLAYILGIHIFAGLGTKTDMFLQYYVIGLTSFQSGIDVVTSYMVLVLAVWIFQKYLINRNWRHTQIFSTVVAGLLQLLMILAYFNVGGTRSAWFTIFLDLDESFVLGLTQVLLSMPVIELASPGQESTTYEMLISVSNASNTLASILSTNLLAPFGVNGCLNANYMECPSDSVAITSAEGFEATNGPKR
jgi:hypothetical protein